MFSKKESDDSELDFDESLNKHNRLSNVDKLEHNQINEYDIMNNVCICMIDIYSFSSWCSNQIPHIIATTMIEYNKLICNTIKKYNS